MTRRLRCRGSAAPAAADVAPLSLGTISEIYAVTTSAGDLAVTTSAATSLLTRLRIWSLATRQAVPLTMEMPDGIEAGGGSPANSSSDEVLLPAPAFGVKLAACSCDDGGALVAVRSAVHGAVWGWRLEWTAQPEGPEAPGALHLALVPDFGGSNIPSHCAATLVIPGPAPKLLLGGSSGVQWWAQGGQQEGTFAEVREDVVEAEASEEEAVSGGEAGEEERAEDGARDGGEAEEGQEEGEQQKKDDDEDEDEDEDEEGSQQDEQEQEQGEGDAAGDTAEGVEPEGGEGGDGGPAVASHEEAEGLAVAAAEQEGATETGEPDATEAEPEAEPEGAAEGQGCEPAPAPEPEPAPSVALLVATGCHAQDDVHIVLVDSDGQLWLGKFEPAVARPSPQGEEVVAEESAQPAGERLRFQRVSLPCKVAEVAVGARTASGLELMLTDGDHGVLWATVRWAQEGQAGAVAGAVTRAALSAHRASGVATLSSDCAAVYGARAISLWMHE